MIYQKSLNTSAGMTTSYVIISVITTDERKHQRMNMSEKCVVQGAPVRQPKGRLLIYSGSATGKSPVAAWPALRSCEE